MSTGIRLGGGGVGAKEQEQGTLWMVGERGTGARHRHRQGVGGGRRDPELEITTATNRESISGFEWLQPVQQACYLHRHQHRPWPTPVWTRPPLRLLRSPFRPRRATRPFSAPNPAVSAIPRKVVSTKSTVRRVGRRGAADSCTACSVQPLTWGAPHRGIISLPRPGPTGLGLHAEQRARRGRRDDETLLEVQGWG